MKYLVNIFRSQSLGNKLLVIIQVLAVLSFGILMATEKAHAQSGNVYSRNQTQVYSATERATVLQVMIKKAEPSWEGRAVGAGIGAGLAALLTSQASGNSRYAVGLLALPLGAAAGERIANATMASDAQEIVLQVFSTDGRPPRIITVVQPAPYDRLVSGEAVYLINTSGAYRVVKSM